VVNFNNTHTAKKAVLVLNWAVKHESTEVQKSDNNKGWEIGERKKLG
jgi:hypothetical protein